MLATNRTRTRAEDQADLRAERLDPLLDARWLEFVEREPSASVFHHPHWLRLLREQYGYRLHACCVTGGGGTLLAGLPLAEIRSRLTGHRLVALPFSDICPPLIADGSPAAALALATTLARERGESGTPLELRGACPQLPSGHVVQRFYQHVLDLQPDVDAVERGFSKSQVRAAVRKARKAGVSVQRRTDVQALDIFYRLHMGTRKRLGVPTQPKRFIRRFAELFEAGLGFALVAELEGEPAAAAVFLTFKQTLTYKYGASDARFLKHRPNNLLFSEAIRWGCTNGFRSLDFGRTEVDNDGLRRFKGNWGAVERPLPYTYAPVAPGEHADGALERLLTTTLRRSPPQVGRLVGAALYRHYG